jgi:hypothetical protein
MLAMLARVAPRSRVIPAGFQALLKRVGPNGEAWPGNGPNGLRWGMDPALNLDSSVEPVAVLSFGGSNPGEGDLNGLWEGVGLEDLGAAKPGTPRSPVPTVPSPPGENLEGSVPARARRPWGRPVPSCAV